MKVIVFDASSLISLAMNGLYREIRELKKVFDGKFIITEQVKYEIIDRSMKVKRFELEALKLKELLDEGVLELPNSLGADNKQIEKDTNELMNVANSAFFGRGKNLHLIDLGESSCLAMGKFLKQQKIDFVLAIDERTTRVLIEKPENLLQILERKMHTKIKMKKTNLKMFAGFKVIRSAELVYILYKKGLTKLKSPEMLDALLYGVKFKGCAISGDEIREIKNLNHKS